MVDPPPIIIEPSGYKCIECGYDLSGAAVGGQCPECGRPIIESLRARNVQMSNSVLPVYAMVLGIVGLVGLLSWAPLGLCSPAAWALGWTARRDIRSGAIIGSFGMATAGVIMGIIGSVLLLLAIGYLMFAFVPRLL